MTHPSNAAEIPDKVEEINTVAFARSYRAWERRRALPDELIALDRRDAVVRARAQRRYGSTSKGVK